MAITASLTITPASPKSGDTITATYAVAGNDGEPAVEFPISGQVAVGGQPFDVSGVATKPAVPPLVEQYGKPTAPGLTFKPTADPHVWTALVP